MDRVGVGLIGCGMIGQIHADGLAKLVTEGVARAVAAADLSRANLERAHRNCEFEILALDALEVVHHPAVDAVMITTPTATHAALVQAALAAGKPLLCEKPLAPEFDTVRTLCDDVARSGLVAQVGFHSRFHPLPERLHALAASGELGRPMGYALRDDQYWPTGDVVAGHSSWRSDRAQAGGGALLEHSIHAADLLSWLFGPAREVFARTRNVFDYDVEDTAAVTIHHESGVVGTLLTIFNGVTGREERRLEVFFERGTVELTTDFVVGAPEDGFRVHRPGEPPRYLDLDVLRDAHFSALGIERRDFLFYAYVADRSWLRAVREGRSASPGFTDALTAHALVEAAYRSAARGAPVPLTGDLAVPTATG